MHAGQYTLLHLVTQVQYNFARADQANYMIHVMPQTGDDHALLENVRNVASPDSHRLHQTFKYLSSYLTHALFDLSRIETICCPPC